MLNKILLIGNLGKDVEIVNTNSGTTIGKFSLATTKSVKGEKVTQWHSVKVFNKTAEICSQYLKKGSKVYLEGEINYDSYEKDGIKKYFTEIIANNVQFLDSKADSQKSGPSVEFDTTQIPF